ncbi:MAG: hypothetical protein AAGN35_13095 [Bacteroidota bacterium]
MKKLYSLLAVLVLLAVAAPTAHAQNDNSNNAVKINDRLPVSGGEKTDFVFTRSFLAGATPDGAPYATARSGIWAIGFGYGFPIGKVMEIKLEPRAAWHKLVFTASPGKTFPTADTSTTLVYEKIRSFYIEVPLGLKFKLARNADDKYKLLLEGGFSFGFNAGSTFKTRSEVDQDDNGSFESRLTTKLRNVQELNSLRYGPYARIGTNWISIYGFYRLTDVFDPNAKIGDDVTGVDYPVFPALEIGFSLML